MATTPVVITFGADGGLQDLYADLCDHDLDLVRHHMGAADAGTTIFNIAASLVPGGEKFPRLIRASRVVALVEQEA